MISIHLSIRIRGSRKIKGKEVQAGIRIVGVGQMAETDWMGWIG